jgi:hypothetical protein
MLFFNQGETMSSDTFHRTGGIALILSGILTISTFFTLRPSGDLTPTGFILDMLSFILLVPGLFVLYGHYKTIAPVSSLAALILSIVGIVVYGVLGPLVPAWENSAGLIGVLGLALPIMLFGISCYRHPQFGLPRMAGMIGILTGLMGVVNVSSILAGGGDWKNAGNASLQTLILVSYATLLLLSTVWCLWTGWVLLSAKSD